MKTDGSSKSRENLGTSASLRLRANQMTGDYLLGHFGIAPPMVAAKAETRYEPG